jgi:hypothetical protein
MKRIMTSLVLILTLSLFTMVPSSEASTSWVREKYLQQTYDEYYEYTFTRYRFGDNDRDVCPEVHKSAIFFAITGRRMRRSAQPRTCLYITKSHIGAHYKPPVAHDVQLIDITVMDVIVFLGEFILYAYKITMVLSWIVLLSGSTLFMIILMFCQY